MSKDTLIYFPGALFTTPLCRNQITKALKDEIEDLKKKLRYREKDIVVMNKRNMTLK
jgi:cupin superfamily acireductone dioxygenase involved in methionine salvage